MEDWWLMGFIFKDSDQTIIKKLNEAFIKKFTQSFYDGHNNTIIEAVVQRYVVTAIRSSQVWQNIINGGAEGLDAHFGIPSGEVNSRLETLLDIWSKEILVKPQPIKRRPRTFTFSYKFYAIKADWADVLSNPAGVTINNSKNARKGIAATHLPWLEWLLVSGDQLEIEGYHIDFNNYAQSRSGKAFMRPQLSWKVPPQEGVGFSTNNNFVTKALEDLTKDQNFRKNLTRMFKNISKMDGGSTISAGDL